MEGLEIEEAEGFVAREEAIMVTQVQRNLQAAIARREAFLAKSLTEVQKAVRHKCFISFHQADEGEVAKFVEDFESVFVPKVLGVSDEDDFINSDDTDYVMEQIREKYLTDSTVTIVLVGKCTWARRYVDWEVFSTLRNDKNNKRSGLLAIELPSLAATGGGKLPPRVNDNVDGDKKYARYWKYPPSASSLRDLIEEAFSARTAKADLIINRPERKKNNSPCS